MNIYDLTKTDLEKYLIDNNEKKYRATQIYEWLYINRAKTFFDMKNINKDLLEKLNKEFSFFNIKTLHIKNKVI